VTVDELLPLTRAVARSVRRSLVVGDLPFGSYQVSDDDAVRTAIRFLKEGGAERAISPARAIAGARAAS